MTFLLPPVQTNEHGAVRTVGFEFEYAGVGFEETAALLANLFGGRHVAERRYVHRVVDTAYGDFRLELDASVLKEESYARFLAATGLGNKSTSLYTTFEDVLEQVATFFVPYEISCPPVPITSLDAVETLRAALYESDAEGTKASLRHAFGMHINAEAPALDAATLLRYLQAFLLLYDWLFEVSAVDVSRRITSFINPFEEPYVRLVLDVGYTPDLRRLLEDYIQHNPTRNRPLDMLPLFAYLDEERVRYLVGADALIQPRPTFHYRLPNCEIGEADWRIAVEWNHWVEVEKLAEDPQKMAAICARYAARLDEGHPARLWAEEVGEWVG